MVKKIGLIVLSILLIVGIFTGISLLGSQHAKSNLGRTSDHFVQDVLADDTSSTYAQLSDSGKSNISQTDWTNLVNQLSSFFRGRTPTRTHADISTDLAVFSYAIQGNDGKYTLTVTLQHTGKTWAVESFTSQLVK